MSYSRASFRIGEPVKQTRPGRHIGELVFKGYAPDRRLCIITVLKRYLERTLMMRGNNYKLFLTSQKPIKNASRDTLRRWTREVLVEAGIDMEIFSPHSTRAASTSKAVHRVPMQTILQTAGWTRESTFQKYYNKEAVAQQDFQDAVLS